MNTLSNTIYYLYFAFSSIIFYFSGIEHACFSLHTTITQKKLYYPYFTIRTSLTFLFFVVFFLFCYFTSENAEMVKTEQLLVHTDRFRKGVKYFHCNTVNKMDDYKKK